MPTKAWDYGPSITGSAAPTAWVPELTGLFRLFAAHQGWAEYFLDHPTVANLADDAFHQIIADFQDEMAILTDTGFHTKEGHADEYKTVLARDLERADGGRNRVIDAPSQAGEPPHLGQSPRLPRVDHSRVQYVGAMGWLAGRARRQYSALDHRFQFINSTSTASYKIHGTNAHIHTQTHVGSGAP